MPVARFQMPDGRVARFEVPDGTTPEQAQAMIEQQLSGKPADVDANPTNGMGTGERLAAGAGRAMTAGGRAVREMVGSSPLGDLNRFATSLLPGNIGQRLALPTAEQSQAATAEAAKLDAPLLATRGGMVGNVLGTAALAAPTALIPGANTYLGATLIGGGLGAGLTEGDGMDRLKGAGLGAVGGAAGKGLGDLIGAGARRVGQWASNRFAQNQAQNAQRMGAARDANAAGYVIPPADLQPGKLTEALSGLSGKIKTAQVASERNQPVTNQLARRALGLADDAELTPEALQALRTAAGTGGYAPIRAAGQVKADKTYSEALDAIAGQYQGAARSFPGAAKNPVMDMVDGLRQPAFDAGDALDMVKVLRETADKAYRTGDTGLGKASKAAAGALEDQLERHLTEAGDKGALAAFREARKQIAKTYTVQKALNPQTGDVSAQVLARDLLKGKPLSDELRTVAQVGAAFPKATQALKESPKALSPLDMAVAGLGTGATGNPLALAGLVARPAARSLLLSPLYQQAALRQASGPGLLSQGLPELLNNELLRQALPGQFGLLAAMSPANQ